MKAIVLLSGGLDSTTTLAIAIHEHHLDPRDITCLSLYYGQKHDVEVLHAKDVADFYRCEYVFKKLDSQLFVGGSLTSDAPMPHRTYKELMEDEGPSPTYVPFRNGNLLSAATSLALIRGAGLVYFGAHAEDAHRWSYPCLN